MTFLFLILISYSIFAETDMIIPAKGLSFNEPEPSKEKKTSIIISLEFPEQLYLLGGAPYWCKSVVIFTLSK